MQKLMMHFFLHISGFCMQIFQHTHRSSYQALKLKCVQQDKLCKSQIIMFPLTIAGLEDEASVCHSWHFFCFEKHVELSA